MKLLKFSVSLFVVFTSMSIASEKSIRTQCKVEILLSQGAYIQTLAHCDQISDSVTVFDKKGVVIFAPISQKSIFENTIAGPSIQLDLVRSSTSFKTMSVNGVNVQAEYPLTLYGYNSFNFLVESSNRIVSYFIKNNIPRVDHFWRPRKCSEVFKNSYRSKKVTFSDGTIINLTDSEMYIDPYTCEISRGYTSLRIDVFTNETKPKLVLAPDVSKFIYDIFGSNIPILDGNLKISCSSASDCIAENSRPL